MSVKHSAKIGSIIGIIFSILFNINVCCEFTLESPHRGDSNEHTQYTIFITKKEITLAYPKSAAIRFFS